MQQTQSIAKFFFEKMLCKNCQHNIVPHTSPTLHSTQSIQYKPAAVPTHVAVPAVHSIQYKVTAVPTHVAAPAVHSIQYKVTAVPTHVAVPAVHK